MCGIFGLWGARANHNTVDQMGETMRHRGPDAGAVWRDRDQHLSLGHRRLSIIDLSLEGAQPMLSASGRLVISLNGEIYNFRTLRRQLEHQGRVFRGHSDTEVLLEAIEAWGVEGALSRATGMFAFALWDREARELVLARDRAGEKPLYYGWLQSGAFCFASELKAVRSLASDEWEIDFDAVASYFKYGFIGEPRSIYRGVSKLQPGTYLRLSAVDVRAEPTPYWSFATVVADARAVPFEGSFESAVDELDQRLTQIVSDQMISDVPLGAFLSGGIDSSIIVAQMQKISSRPVKTFTIGFDERAYDESESAAEVARLLKTDHTTLKVSAKAAAEIIPAMLSVYDEPFADSSQLPTYLLSQMTRRSVTVALSGDGGDEVFGGYNRYFFGQRWMSRLHQSPRMIRRWASRTLNQISPSTWNHVFDFLGQVSGGRVQLRLAGLKMQKIARVLTADTPGDVYDLLASVWPDLERAGLKRGGLLRDSAVEGRLPKNLSFTEFMMAYDFLTYLPGDILVKVDRAAMAHSLETRVPFLNHDLIKWAWSLPLSFKVQPGRGKLVLKALLARSLDRRVFERPKMGFGIPVGEWIKSDLRDWAEDLLSPHKIKSAGVLDPLEVTKKWSEHLSGRRDWSQLLWTVLTYQMWTENQRALSSEPLLADLKYNIHR